jgi:hypothetical protein
MLLAPRGLRLNASTLEHVLNCAQHLTGTAIEVEVEVDADADTYETDHTAGAVASGAA